MDALADIRSGKGFTSNVDGIAFKKEKAAGNGFLYTLSIPDKKYDRIEDKLIEFGVLREPIDEGYQRRAVFDQSAAGVGIGDIAKRTNSFTACSGFFSSAKEPQVFTTPTTKNSTNNA